MKSLLHKAWLLGAGVVLAASSANAAFTFAATDIVLGFRGTNVGGASTSLYVNLGDQVAFSNNPSFSKDISAALVDTFGANWYERNDVYFGVFAGRSALTPAADPGTPGVTEPGRTVFVSSPTLTIGGGAFQNSSWNTNTLSNGITQFAGLRNDLVNGVIGETSEGSGVGILVNNGTNYANSWATRVTQGTTPGYGFNNFLNIEQYFGNFDPLGEDIERDEWIVDVQRLTPGTGGTYVGSIIIDNNGLITAVPEASTGLLALGAGLLAVTTRRRNKA